MQASAAMAAPPRVGGSCLLPLWFLRAIADLRSAQSSASAAVACSAMRHASRSRKAPDRLRRLHSCDGTRSDFAEQQRIIHELRLRAGGLARASARGARRRGELRVVAGALAFGGDSRASSRWRSHARCSLHRRGQVEFDMPAASPCRRSWRSSRCLRRAGLAAPARSSGIAWLLTRLRDLWAAAARRSGSWVTVGNGWLSWAPRSSLIVAGAHDAGDAGPALLLRRAGRQFAMDAPGVRVARGGVPGFAPPRAGCGSSRPWPRSTPRSHRSDSSSACRPSDEPWAPLALVPLLAVLGMFARERRERCDRWTSSPTRTAGPPRSSAT